MYCLSCGTSLPTEAKFCVQCGARIVPTGDNEEINTAGKVEPKLKPEVAIQPEHSKKTVPAAGSENKIARTIAGFLLVALILFAIIGAIGRIFSLSATAIQGHIGAEDLLLVFVAGLVAYWIVNRAKKK